MKGLRPDRPRRLNRGGQLQHSDGRHRPRARSSGNSAKAI
jgi:hypothetical protein